MRRKYYPYWEWEDFNAGMWNSIDKSNESEMLEKAIAFTGNHYEYGKAMIKVTEKWSKTCEHNLTDETQNRKAWIGHAAACLEIKCPEHITRQAWGYLTKEQQDNANNVALIAIKKWEKENNYNERSYYAKELFDI